MLNTASGADISSSLTSFFNKMGVASNVTPPALFKDQAAGYATGGGISFSGNVMDTKLGHIEMPNVRYGNCGDIDIYAGGLSFISGEKIVQTLKSVATSSAGYAFMLALETVSPQFANNVKQLQSWANTINSIGINSCETAASMVSAVWPRYKEATNAICRSTAANNGVLKDYIDARHGCSELSQFNAMMDKAEGENPNILKDEFNIAWKVMEGDSFFSGEGSEQLKHLFMSITGTVVAKKQSGGKLKVDAFPSKVFDEQFMQRLMEGGSAPIYSCSDSGSTKKCLNVSESAVDIGSELAIKSKLEKLLGRMQRKVTTDEKFNDEEVELLNKTRLPLLRILNVMSAYRQGAAPISLAEYADVVAIDMVCQYIRNVLDVIRLNISRKMQLQFDASVLERYEESLNRVEARVLEYEHKTQKRMDQLLAIERKLNLLEKDIFSRMRATAPY
jgi:conjugative transfer pilus assembly protein TraH